MRILANIDPFKDYFENSVVTIGNFDGVHLGHQEILRRLKEKSALTGFPSVAVTFDPHPLKILSPENSPLLINTTGQKAALIEKEGVDCLVLINFTREFSRMEASDFVHSILCRCLGMRHIVIGHDYAFGKGRKGSFETLRIMGSEYGFTVEDLDPIGSDEVIYSSSMVRRLVSNGRVSDVEEILGRHHFVSGRVVHGREIGRRIGFPTANISCDNELVPGDGVYAVRIEVDGVYHNGASSVGINPTFGGGGRTLEVFLLDFNGELYGKKVVVHFVERIRDIKKFPDAETLASVIREDIEKCRRILRKDGR